MRTMVLWDWEATAVENERERLCKEAKEAEAEKVRRSMDEVEALKTAEAQVRVATGPMLGSLRKTAIETAMSDRLGPLEAEGRDVLKQEAIKQFTTSRLKDVVDLSPGSMRGEAASWAKFAIKIIESGGDVREAAGRLALALELLR